MNQELLVLSVTAASVGFIHTILGPDHYIPFIAMARAGKWSLKKTIWITILSGIGHVLSSVLIGIAGVAFGIALHKIEAFENYRGNIAGWAFISFGLIYFVWGLRRAIKNKPHTHLHKHKEELLHSHTHTHHNDHAHIHEKENMVNLTPWIIFTIFVFGPCEALIPILMYPAVNISLSGMFMVTLIFATTTISTMLGIVLISLYGIDFLPLQKFEKYSHAIAGLILVISGVSIQFLGL